jgi:uncharacterized protein (TIGR03032 family)
MSDAISPPATTSAEPWVQVTGSPRLWSWLAEHQVSLPFSTYQTGKLFLLGRHPEGRLDVVERTFNRAMGLWADGQTIWLSSLYQIWRFENLLNPGELYQGRDRLYVPKVANTTGDLDIHDVAIDAAGRPVFVATAFGCIATVADCASFTPLWRPPFLSRAAAGIAAISAAWHWQMDGRASPQLSARVTSCTVGATGEKTAAWC